MKGPTRRGAVSRLLKLHSVNFNGNFVYSSIFRSTFLHFGLFFFGFLVNISFSIPFGTVLQVFRTMFLRLMATVTGT